MISIDIMPKWIFYGYLGIHMPLCIGMTVVPIADPVNERLSEIINRFHPQSVAGVPGHAMDLLDNDNVTDLSSLTTIGIGGDSMPLEAEKRLNDLLQRIGGIKYCSPGYGASENTSVATANQGEVYKEGSVGIPFYDVNLMVIDKDKYEQDGEIVELGYDQDGIICFNGNLMLGYYGDDDESNKVIKEYNGERWYISGDVGYIDQDGFVFFLNREKDLVVLPDGFKVVPKVIEDVVSTNPMVKRCVVVGKKYEDDSAGERPCCYIQIKKSSSLLQKEILEKEIRKSIKRQLSSYYMPREIIFVKDIKMTPMGKVDRKKYHCAGCIE
ncbi:MAG: acyl--CoA ligase [Lachnospiraceae bacterium]|nr:acyl--CoA ligase [Lachnospiraceae bacterium]